MIQNNRICRWLFIVLLSLPLVGFTSIPVKSIVVFGDSLSDNGNTTHLLKSLRQEEDPAFLVAPFKIFVINKMIEFANDYYVPQMVLDAGISAVTDFFDHDLAPYLANLVGKVKQVRCCLANLIGKIAFLMVVSGLSIWQKCYRYKKVMKKST